MLKIQNSYKDKEKTKKIKKARIQQHSENPNLETSKKLAASKK